MKSTPYKGVVRGEDGTEYTIINWRNDIGELHRENGPAVIKQTDNSKSWWIRNKRTSFHTSDLLDNNDWSIGSIIYVRIR
jgi:hypothetical protein